MPLVRKSTRKLPSDALVHVPATVIVCGQQLIFKCRQLLLSRLVAEAQRVGISVTIRLGFRACFRVGHGGSRGPDPVLRVLDFMTLLLAVKTVDAASM